MTQSSAKPGPKPLLFPDDRTLKAIRTMSAAHNTQTEAAALLGVSVRTFEQFLHDFSEARDAWDNGVHAGKGSLRRRIFEVALAGDVQMLKFVGKNWLGMDAEEKQKVETTIDDRRPITRAEALERVAQLMAKHGVAIPTTAKDISPTANPKHTGPEKRLPPPRRG